MNPLSDTNTPPLNPQENPQPEEDRILCPHCRRTARNGIKCKGICVADSDY